MIPLWLPVTLFSSFLGLERISLHIQSFFWMKLFQSPAAPILVTARREDVDAFLAFDEVWFFLGSFIKGASLYLFSFRALSAGSF